MDQGGGREVPTRRGAAARPGKQERPGRRGRILVTTCPPIPTGQWHTHLIDDSMHVTHNFDLVHWDGGGAKTFCWVGWRASPCSAAEAVPGRNRQSSRQARVLPARCAWARRSAGRFLAAVEPWHGNTLVVYMPSAQGGSWQRNVLADDLNEGHGLACADFLGLGSDQIVVGWRNPNAKKQVGIRLVRAARCSGLNLDIPRDRRQHDGLRGLESGGS